MEWDEITQGLKVFKKEKGSQNGALGVSNIKSWRTEEQLVQMAKKEGERNQEKCGVLEDSF